MAKKEIKTALSRSKYREVWRHLHANNWLTLAQEYRKDQLFTLVGPNVIRGKCINPDHDDSTPSFFIHTNEGYAHCFGCGMHLTDPITLSSMFMSLTTSETITRLKDVLKISILSKTKLKEIEEQSKVQYVKKTIFNATKKLLSLAIADRTNPAYGYAIPTINWLTNTRQIPVDSLFSLPVGVMPPIAVLTDFILRETALFNQTAAKGNELPSITDDVNSYLKDNIHWPHYVGSVVFPLHSTFNDIGKLKLRSIVAKDYLITLDEFEDMNGLFGLGWEPYKDLITTTKTVYAVEGEMDALSVMARFVMGNGGVAKYPIISLGGTGCSPFIEPILTSLGVEKIKYIADAPNARGNEDIESWLENTKTLKSQVYVGWEDDFKGMKDPDEVVCRLGEPAFTSSVYDRQKTTFVCPSDWCTEQAQDRFSRMIDTDPRALIEMAATSGRCLQNRIERETYINAISGLLQINKNILAREISAREPTEQGFILNCIDALKTFFFVVGHRSDISGRSLVLYNRQTRSSVSIKLGAASSVQQELAPIAGRLIDFVETYVGFPAFLDPPGVANSIGDSKLTKNLMHYFNEACLSMAHGAPDMSREQLKQGYHLTKNAAGDQLEYVVCGPDVFRLKRGINDVDYVKLEGPADHENGLVFNTESTFKGRECWAGNFLTVDRLKALNGFDAKSLYRDLTELYSVGFKFENHSLTPKLLAAAVMSLPVSSALARAVIMFLTGDTSSGKTTFLSTIHPDMGYPGINILSMSHGSDSYTLAAVATQANSDSRPFILDEFESMEASKATVVPAILEMIRGVATGTAVRTIGTPGGGKEVKQSFRMPVIFAAIQGTSKAQDLNRLLLVKTVKDDTIYKPADTIISRLGAKRIEEMREQTTLGMFQYALEIAKNEEEINKEYGLVHKDLAVNMGFRQATSLFAALAVMKLVGEDWLAFLKEYVTATSGDIKRGAELSESEVMLDNILRNPVAQGVVQGRMCSLAELLVAPDRRLGVNSSEYGTFFDPKTNYLVLLLDTVLQKLVPSSLRRFGAAVLTTQQLKVTLERHKLAVLDTEVERSGVLTRVSNVLGANIKLKDVVVIRANQWLGNNFDVETNVPATSAVDTAADEVDKHGEADYNSL